MTEQRPPQEPIRGIDITGERRTKLIRYKNGQDQSDPMGLCMWAVLDEILSHGETRVNDARSRVVREAAAKFPKDRFRKKTTKDLFDVVWGMVQLPNFPEHFER